MLYAAFTCAEDQPKCRSFCTMDYNPVCGGGPTGEKQTFSNLCAFDVHKCTKKLTGRYLYTYKIVSFKYKNIFQIQIGR